MTGETKADELSLAADFGPARHDAWLKLVDKVLAGAPFDKKLVSRTYDGLAIQPLYTREDWNAAGDPSGFPGGAPYTRGGSVLGTAQGGWDIRQRHAHPDPEVANRQILEDLERGVTSVTLKIDASGQHGICVRSRRDMEALLKGLLLDIAPVILEPVGPSLPITALMVDALRAMGMKNADFAGNFGTDPLGTLAVSGKMSNSLDDVMARMADTAAFTAANFPKARGVNIKTAGYHSAGAADAQELACGLAAAVEYLRAMVATGLDIDAACGQIAFTVTVDADMFMSIAKIRVLRRLWGRVAEACGADAEGRTVPVTAITAPRMFAKRDPWVNILRGTIACFAAGVAGADAITVLPLDHALGEPSTLARRVARNTHIVLQEESGVARVIDPAGGAWTFEKLTDDLAAAAWSFFQKIEKAGGMKQAIVSGLIAQEIGAVRDARLANIGKRKDPLTGVSEFPNLHEVAAKADAVDLAAVLKARDQVPAGTVAKLPPAGKGTLMTALVEAVKAGANQPAMIGALATPDGVTAPKLPSIRLGQEFEALRDAGDAFKAKFGAWPKVFLANLGTIAEFTARATFAKNFVEAGGLEAVGGTGGTDAKSIAADFKRSGAAFAVICGTDAVYGEQATTLAKALTDAGAGMVLLAGRGGEREAELRTAGVGGFIFIGCDVPAVLKDMHSRLEAA